MRSLKKAGIFVVIATVLGVSSCTSFSRSTELKTDIDTMSYYYGLSRADGVIEHLLTQGIDTTHMNAFLKGLREGAKNYSPEDVAYSEGVRMAQMINNQWVKNINNDIFMGDPSKTINRKAFFAGFYHGTRDRNGFSIMNAQTYAQIMMDAIREEYKLEKFAAEIAAAEKYLAENKNRAGVTTTPSGLQYKIITEGKGDIPDERSRVRVHYRGTLIDGTVFDTSYGNEAPSSFRVDQVVSGWTEALTMMPVGSKWELYIPHDLAYGSTERPAIPPYSTLIFEVELFEIE